MLYIHMYGINLHKNMCFNTEIFLKLIVIAPRVLTILPYVYTSMHSRFCLCTTITAQRIEMLNQQQMRLKKKQLASSRDCSFFSQDTLQSM